VGVRVLMSKQGPGRNAGTKNSKIPHNLILKKIETASINKRNSVSNGVRGYNVV
jgi:hypothetical protein